MLAITRADRGGTKFQAAGFGVVDWGSGGDLVRNEATLPGATLTRARLAGTTGRCTLVFADAQGKPHRATCEIATIDSAGVYALRCTSHDLSSWRRDIVGAPVVVSQDRVFAVVTGLTTVDGQQRVRASPWTTDSADALELVEGDYSPTGEETWAMVAVVAALLVVAQPSADTASHQTVVVVTLAIGLALLWLARARGTLNRQWWTTTVNEDPALGSTVVRRLMEDPRPWTFVASIPAVVYVAAASHGLLATLVADSSYIDLAALVAVVVLWRVTSRLLGSLHDQLAERLANAYREREAKWRAPRQRAEGALKFACHPAWVPAIGVVYFTLVAGTLCTYASPEVAPHLLSLAWLGHLLAIGFGICLMDRASLAAVVVLCVIGGLQYLEAHEYYAAATTVFIAASLAHNQLVADVVRRLVRETSRRAAFAIPWVLAGFMAQFAVLSTLVHGRGWVTLGQVLGQQLNAGLAGEVRLSRLAAGGTSQLITLDVLALVLTSGPLLVAAATAVGTPLLGPPHSSLRAAIADAIAAAGLGRTSIAEKSLAAAGALGAFLATLTLPSTPTGTGPPDLGEVLVKQGTCQPTVRSQGSPLIPGHPNLLDHTWIRLHHTDQSPVRTTCGVARPGLWVQSTEMTQAQWTQAWDDKRDLARTFGLARNPSLYLGTTRPVDGVSFCAALRMANLLSHESDLDIVYVPKNTRTRAPTVAEAALPHCERGHVSRRKEANGYRLPTGEEWEGAARGSSHGTLFANGSVFADQDREAWTSRNSGAITHAVALLRPNANGLYDALGNVSEWVWSDELPGGGFPPLSTSAAGGAAICIPEDCTLSNTSGTQPLGRFGPRGVRYVRDVTATTTTQPQNSAD